MDGSPPAREPMTREVGRGGEGQARRRAGSPRRCAWCRESFDGYLGTPEVHAGKSYHPDCWRYGAKFDRQSVGWETDADQQARAARRRP